MSDPIPEVGLHVTGRRGRRRRRRRRLSPPEGCTNSVLVVIRTITTDHRAITSTPINFCLRSSRQRHILWHLHNQLNSDDHWLCDYLASKISTAAINYGFGHSGFQLTMNVTLTYPYVPVVPVPSLSNTEVSSKVLRMVLSGKKAEELKSLNMETESCSICLENLVSGSKRPTRMSCSHVFHDGCLLPWLYRENTCPLCRTELYER